ncbi:MAG: LytR/AlgR family response regulator transcription factor [Myxococcales bacterium]|jgi:two-component system LytT family response regulator
MSEPSLKVLVADDELMARRRLLRLLAAVPGVEACGEAKDGEQVLARIGARDVDVVLLDINMPGLSGMDAAQLMPKDGPLVIFCTAHSQHAVQAFDEEAVDYLLKPVEAWRLQRALDRARARLALRRLESATPPAPAAPPAAAAPERIAIPTRHGIVLVAPESVTHAVLDGELVTLHTTEGEYLCDYSLAELELKAPGLERVHRRALLNLAHVVRL